MGAHPDDGDRSTTMTDSNQPAATAKSGRRDPRIVIVGAGMAGIAAAHVFRQAGFPHFTILEKGCDVPSYGYQYAFAPKPDWKHVWATGREIQQYHHDLIRALHLESHLRLDCE